MDPVTGNLTVTNVTYNELKYTVIGTSLYALLSISGFLGNILIMLTVTCIKSMRTPTNCYLMSLACADFLLFASGMPTEFANFYHREDEFIFGDVYCRLKNFLTYLAINASSLSITAFTVERYIGICHPMKAQYLCTVRRACIVVIVIWAISIVYNASWLFLTGTTPFVDGLTGDVLEKCNFKYLRHLYLPIFMVDFVSFYAVPLVLYFVLYGRIAIILLKPQFGVAVPTKQRTTRGENNNTGKKKQGNDSRAANPHSQTRARSQVVRMLVIIVIIFAVCWLPYRSIVVYNSFAPTEYRWYDVWYYFFAKTMIYVNSATNPILYNIMSAKFRQGFGQLLCFWKSKSALYSQGQSTRFQPLQTNSALTTKTHMAATRRTQANGSALNSGHKSSFNEVAPLKGARTVVTFEPNQSHGVLNCEISAIPSVEPSDASPTLSSGNLPSSPKYLAPEPEVQMFFQNQQIFKDGKAVLV